MSQSNQTHRIRVDQAKNLARKLAEEIKGGEVFALIGQLGSGKTTFTQHLGRALGLEQTIASPTFIIMQEYPIALRSGEKKPGFFYHLDLYRIHSPADISALGLEQIWSQPNTVTVIEWADKIKHLLPPQTTFIYFADNH